MGTTRQTHGTPGCGHVDYIHGLGIAAAGGHESAPIRWAWVSGDPAGIESEAGRRALSQRRSGGVISRERRAWGSGNPGTRKPAGGLGRATAGGGYLPRSAGMRARGQQTCGTRGDPAELPAVLQWAMAGYNERRLPCAGQTGNRNKIKTFKTKKNKNKVKGRRLLVGLVFCHGAHTREDTGTRRRGLKLK